MNKDILPTKLCTHKDDVEFINKKELDSLQSEKYTYNSIDSGDINFTRKLLNVLCPAKEEIVLKLNSQVMLTKNLDFGSSLVNGSRGYVTGFSESKLPIVKFLNGNELTLKYESWSYKINSAGVLATRKQVPVQLAYAISIHKSQVSFNILLAFARGLHNCFLKGNDTRLC